MERAMYVWAYLSGFYKSMVRS